MSLVVLDRISDREAQHHYESNVSNILKESKELYIACTSDGEVLNESAIEYNNANGKEQNLHRPY